MPLITFEGSEGCGKSTQVCRLAAELEKLGIATAVFREPGGTEIGERIRQLLQDSQTTICPETELLLFAASRSELVRKKIRPALQRREFVICDRFFDSTTIYQGMGRELDADFVEQLNRFAASEANPDLTFVLDLSRAAARGRIAQRAQVPDRMEELPEDFFARVTQAYRELAQRESKRVVLIDGSPPPDEVERQVRDIVLERFPEIRVPVETRVS